MSKGDEQQIVGHAGAVAARNVARLRGDMSYAEVSRRLNERGHALAPLALRRIERGARRIDVDDLVNLADVLGVTPLGILLPYDQQLDKQVPYLAADTEGGPTTRELWDWALSGRPLNDDDDGRLIQVRTMPQGVRGALPGGRDVPDGLYQKLGPDELEALGMDGAPIQLEAREDGTVLVFGGLPERPIVGTIDEDDLFKVLRVIHQSTGSSGQGGLGVGFSRLTVKKDGATGGDD